MGQRLKKGERKVSMKGVPPSVGFYFPPPVPLPAAACKCKRMLPELTFCIVAEIRNNLANFQRIVSSQKLWGKFLFTNTG